MCPPSEATHAVEGDFSDGYIFFLLGCENTQLKCLQRGLIYGKQKEPTMELDHAGFVHSEKFKMKVESHLNEKAGNS